MSFNYYYSLPTEIIQHIQYFVKIHYVNKIKKAWINYISHKLFILDLLYNIIYYPSIINNTSIFNPMSNFTYFYFKKLNNLINGRELYLNDYIKYLYYILALSIDEFQQFNYTTYTNYHFQWNLYYCLYNAYKFNWNNIMNFLL